MLFKMHISSTDQLYEADVQRYPPNAGRPPGNRSNPAGSYFVPSLRDEDCIAIDDVHNFSLWKPFYKRSCRIAVWRFLFVCALVTEDLDWS